MDIIESIPFELRLALLFLIGTFLASLANWATYRLAWNPRRIGPWTVAEPGAPSRLFSDRIPIFGWLGLRRESKLHGSTFWIRPMLVEFAAGFALAWLYWWEIDQLALLPLATPRPAPIEWLGMLHVQFVVHVALFWMMLVATLIDTDEKTIPDTITLPGTLLGLFLAATIPNSLLPGFSVPPGAMVSGQFWKLVTPEQWPFLTLATPNKMPVFFLAGCPTALVIGLGCWWLWCVGLMHRCWYSRCGWRLALIFFLVKLKRSLSTYCLLLLGLVGTFAIVLVWNAAPDPASGGVNRAWVGLITALVGMAAAGGLVWVVRLIGAAVLQREAMGFGDVTLMAMFGAFLGWQVSMITFFFAPMIAVLVGLGMWVLRRENEVPFGPFLCIAASVVLLGWANIWSWASLRFGLGMLIPLIIGGCLVLMPVMLGIWLIIKRVLTSPNRR